MVFKFSFLSLLILLGVLNQACGLFEDQIGKFDWRHQYIGKPTHALIDNSGKRIVVATDENVLAVLQAGTGKLEWRQILSSGPQNKISSLLLLDAGKVAVVSGIPNIARAFDITSGILLWESLLSKDSQATVFSSWTSNNKDVISVDITPSDSGHQLVVTEFNSYSGAETVTQTFSLPWFNKEFKCELAYPHLFCVSNSDDGVNVVDVRDPESYSKLLLTELGIEGSSEIGVTKHNPSTSPFIWIRTADQLSVFKTGQDQTLIPLTKLPSNTRFIDIPVLKESGEKKQYLAWLTDGYDIEVLDIESNKVLSNIGGKLVLPDHVGLPSLFVIHLMRKQQGDVSYRFLISTLDHALIYGSRKDVYWIREESLASIVQVEMVDLPVSETEASIEEEFGADANNMLTHIIRRLGSQLRQLSIFSRNVFQRVDQNARSTNSKLLVRDRFGLHKLILIVTKPGKIFAMDTVTGRIVWQRLLKGVTADKLHLFVQRTSIHYPLEARCTILVHSADGNSILYVFHPITGLPVEGDGYIHLDYQVQQAMLLPQNEETEFIKTLILLDQHSVPHVYPEADFAVSQVTKMAGSLYFFTADTKSCLMQGYSLASSTSDRLAATPIWKLQLCSSVSESREEISKIVARHPEEKVHSQGRVLADRSVLYKYLNPNLVVVTTEGTHPHYRGYLNIYLIDVVSGAVVFSASHRRVLGPVHVVHAENWVVYSYYNEKFRRTELASLELFEGQTQGNSTAFSSFAAPQPLVDRQAYIYPSHITAMKDTFSEQGMTAKHILVSLSNGWIQELPRVFVDPRRPQVAVATPEMREEGIIPYLPELPIPPEAIINYNQTASNIRGIYVAPSSLESTGLVFAYGLDIFFTHVTPSRTFDVLNDDFEFFFIALVLIGLTIASLITKRLASKKALRQAWK